MVRKIGLYGGTFDPIHFGHLNLAIQLSEIHQLDEVWVIPAKISPHKSQTKPISVEQRIAMTQLAIAEIPHFKLLDIESKREGPSYTVDTLRILKKDFPKDQFFLMLGNDSIPGFFQWHQPEEIVSLAPLLIGQRNGQDYLKEVKNNSSIVDAMKKGMTKTRIVEISATEIRDRLKKKMYCGHLLPSKVIDFITQNSLYLQIN